MPSADDRFGGWHPFAHQRSDLLNRTVCNGIRITPVLTETGQCRVAYGITKNDWVPSRLIPLTLGRAAPRAYVRLFHSLQWDPEQQFLADGRSYIGLYAHDDIEDDGACLIRYDYNRDIKVNANDQGYPALTCMCSAATQHTTRSLNDAPTSPKSRTISTIRSVAGATDRRWKTSSSSRSWRASLTRGTVGGTRIAQYRSVWRDLQLRAAVRRDPNPAAETLASLGWTVAAPQ